jgi:hypothetical protein
MWKTIQAYQSHAYYAILPPGHTRDGHTVYRDAPVPQSAPLPDAPGATAPAPLYSVPDGLQPALYLSMRLRASWRVSVCLYVATDPRGH